MVSFRLPPSTRVQGRSKTLQLPELANCLVMRWRELLMRPRNSVVYHTEKQLKELGDKVPSPVKEKVEAMLGELKEAISGGSTQAIKDAMAALNQEVMQLGQSLYNQPGASGPGGAAPGGATGPSESSENKGPDGDIIDADFSDSK
ncbi:hypothetical protein MLD38_032231 [Melastoma candidum]|uniref:Uncharacterized protein n=1 Tax=Melastoma candidum TaxID=119954 RepID=A0ACB9M6K8_9MYRT|nr:hypothetical protein MLD38_032231 [Melastoma candidum]